MDWNEFCKIAGWGSDPSINIQQLVSEVNMHFGRPVVYVELLAYLLNSKFKGVGVQQSVKELANPLKDIFFAVLMKAVENNRWSKFPDRILL